MFSLLAVRIKLKPFSAKQLAISKPMPEEAPVINAYESDITLILPVYIFLR
jgi:hypothetical protein